MKELLERYYAQRANGEAPTIHFHIVNPFNEEIIFATPEEAIAAIIELKPMEVIVAGCESPECHVDGI